MTFVAVLWLYPGYLLVFVRVILFVCTMFAYVFFYSEWYGCYCVFERFWCCVSVVVLGASGRKYMRIVFDMFLGSFVFREEAGLEFVVCVLVGFGVSHDRMSLVCCFILVFSCFRHWRICDV